MSIKDQISAEIERRLKAIANSPSDGGEMDAINGARCLELMSFRKYIDSLPEQPVEGLDEAAEESWAEYEYRETPQGLYSSCYKDGFIAGADWQKAKMMEDAVEGEVTTDNRGNNVVRAGVFNKDFEYGDKVKIIIIKEC